MKKVNLLYWIFTGLFCLMMGGSAIPDILSDPIAVAGMHGELGYPVYFIPFIGWAKALGVLALLVPLVPSRLKEWAYAGLAFDIIGAGFSLAAVGKSEAPFMILPFALGALSYFLWHKKQSLKSAAIALPRERMAASAA